MKWCIFPTASVADHGAHRPLHPYYCILGWGNLALFSDFQKVTQFCWSGIFLGGQFQKICKFCHMQAHRKHSKVFILIFFCLRFRFLLYPEILQYYRMILQHPRIIVGDAGFEPRTSTQEVWRDTKWTTTSHSSHLNFWKISENLHTNIFFKKFSEPS